MTTVIAATASNCVPNKTICSNIPQATFDTTWLTKNKTTAESFNQTSSLNGIAKIVWAILVQPKLESSSICANHLTVNKTISAAGGHITIATVQGLLCNLKTIFAQFQRWPHPVAGHQTIYFVVLIQSGVIANIQYDLPIYHGGRNSPVTFQATVRVKLELDCTGSFAKISRVTLMNPAITFLDFSDVPGIVKTGASLLGKDIKSLLMSHLQGVLHSQISSVNHLITTSGELPKSVPLPCTSVTGVSLFTEMGTVIFQYLDYECPECTTNQSTALEKASCEIRRCGTGDSTNACKLTMNLIQVPGATKLQPTGALIYVSPSNKNDVYDCGQHDCKAPHCRNCSDIIPCSATKPGVPFYIIGGTQISNDLDSVISTATPSSINKWYFKYDPSAAAQEVALTSTVSLGKYKSHMTFRKWLKIGGVVVVLVIVAVLILKKFRNNQYFTGQYR